MAFNLSPIPLFLLNTLIVALLYNSSIVSLHEQLISKWVTIKGERKKGRASTYCFPQDYFA